MNQCLGFQGAWHWTPGLFGRAMAPKIHIFKSPVQSPVQNPGPVQGIVLPHGSMQKLDSGLDWTMDWTLDWTLDSMYFSSYRPCHHKYSPLFASTSVLRRFCTLACMVFRLSKPAKAGLCFPKHALICILIITLIIKAAYHTYYQGSCWATSHSKLAVTVGVFGGGGGGGGE